VLTQFLEVLHRLAVVLEAMPILRQVAQVVLAVVVVQLAARLERETVQFKVLQVEQVVLLVRELEVEAAQVKLELALLLQQQVPMVAMVYLQV
tara:strand:- start:1070 stop:1348 length:279 start_codon:yes stop_codon:yes gene_type:complete